MMLTGDDRTPLNLSVCQKDGTYTVGQVLVPVAYPISLTVPYLTLIHVVFNINVLV